MNDNRMDFLEGMIQDLKDRNLYSELPVLGLNRRTALC